jgi:hypothetical protein
MPITCRVGVVQYPRNEKVSPQGRKEIEQGKRQGRVADGAEKMNGYSLPFLRGVLPINKYK